MYYVVAPAISWHIIGQKPLYSYQYSMIKSLVGAPVTGGVQSVTLSADVCRYFLGNLPAPAAVILLISMGIALLTHAPKFAAKASPEEGVLLCRRIATHLAVATTMLLALTFILVSRLPAMLWIDVRRSP